MCGDSDAARLCQQGLANGKDQGTRVQSWVHSDHCLDYLPEKV